MLTEGPKAPALGHHSIPLGSGSIYLGLKSIQFCSEIGLGIDLVSNKVYIFQT